ncbi:MAG TPA: hypothetical protein VFO82_04160 [Steroidobacteraceae bacterium]|nr:hypothetical protein [Steroidobacteraceae bacterium]
MPENPYAPPAATVADVESGVESLERPRIVTRGIGLLWAYLVVSVPSVFLPLSPPSVEDDSDSFMLAMQTGAMVATVLMIAVLALLTWFAWKGRNWARITHLVLVIIGMLSYGLVLLAGFWLEAGQESFSEEWYLNVLYLLQTVLNVAGVWLLFTRSANAWYRAMKIARAAGHFTG